MYLIPDRSSNKHINKSPHTPKWSHILGSRSDIFRVKLRHLLSQPMRSLSLLADVKFYSWSQDRKTGLIRSWGRLCLCKGVFRAALLMDRNICVWISGARGNIRIGDSCYCYEVLFDFCFSFFVIAIIFLWRLMLIIFIVISHVIFCFNF